MTSVNDWGLKFLRWGMGLSVVGLITGYLPLGHYLMKDAMPSCPAAPVHGHTILLSFVGMSIFGLIYRAIADSMVGGDAPLALIRLHFRVGYGAAGPLVLVWPVIVDLFCITMLIWIITGLILWWKVRDSRRLGWVTILAGFATIGVLMMTV